MPIVIVDTDKVLVAGDPYVFELTLLKEKVLDVNYLVGVVSMKASIWPGGDDPFLIIDKPLTLIDAPTARADLSLTAADTLLLAPGLPNYANKSIIQYGDIEVVELSGRVSHNGPYKFEVRRKITN